VGDVMRAISGRVVVVGDVFCDIIMRGVHGLPRWGEEVFADEPVMCPGGVATVAIGLARLGEPTTLLARTRAQDTIAQVVDDELAGHDGLDVRWLLPAPSTAITVAVRDATERALISYAPPSEVGPVAPEVPWEQLDGASHIHIGGWHEGDRPLDDQCEIFRTARARNLTTSLDTSLGSDDEPASRVRELIRQVDVFLPNAAEACWLTGADDAMQALERLSELVPTVVITMGGDGAVASSRGVVRRVAGIPAEVVDTTGAGDAFTAGFLHGFVRHWPLERCLALANVCGCLSVARIGSSISVPDGREAFDVLERQHRSRPPRPERDRRAVDARGAGEAERPRGGT
jgi:sugar/nucleoside kinase (ribokinase family)